MVSLVLTLVVSVGAFLAGRARFGLGSGIFLAIVAGLGTLVLLFRRTRKPIQAAMTEIETHIKARRFDRAIDKLKDARRLGIWQPLLASQVDEQIGVIYQAALNDPDKARPYLERARNKGVQAWTLLAAGHYRGGRFDEAARVLERASRRRPKEGLVWGTYAWCRLHHGGRAQALDVLASGRKRLPNDDRLRRLQLALQNGKELRMRVFGQDWYALGLERMPQGPGGGISPDHPALRRRQGGGRGRGR